MDLNKDAETDSDDVEDIPNDFFDDFNKAEFMAGLSVIDDASWDENKGVGNKRGWINSEVVDSVKDLRELIGDGQDDDRKHHKRDSTREKVSREDHHRFRSKSNERLDDFIKPGSRRDLNKTNEAIRRDKERKLKEHLAKQLEATDDLRPPGTELDDFFNFDKPPTLNEIRGNQTNIVQHSPHWSPHCSPEKTAVTSTTISPQFSPRHIKQSSPANSHTGHRFRSRSPLERKRSVREKRQNSIEKRQIDRRRSPVERRRSPKERRRSPIVRRRSPIERRWSPNERRQGPIERRQGFIERRRSPLERRRNSNRRSPVDRRRSPKRRSPVDRRRSIKHRSPLPGSPRRRKQSLSPLPFRTKNESHNSRSWSREPIAKDSFLYPKEPLNTLLSSPRNVETETIMPYTISRPEPYPLMDIPLPYPVAPGYSYPQAPVYTPDYSFPYDNGVSLGAPMSVPQVEPVGTPVHMPVPNSFPAPAMVPAPHLPSSLVADSSNSMMAVAKKSPYDALAQLLAEGKISKSDYLKLTPNKGADMDLTPKFEDVKGGMDTKTRVMVLNRCSTALTNLGKLLLPNRLVMNNSILGPEPKSLEAKFCSPLKRQAPVEFHFTKVGGSTNSQGNKQLINGILCAVGLDDGASKSIKKTSKDMKSVATQTSKPYCDVCEIRETTRNKTASTSIEREHFSSTVHTQVIEQDLMNSKAIFNPTGSIADGAPISIAHMTPAQLVSQLAARAKSLKHTTASSSPPPPPQFQRWNTQNNPGGSYQGYGNHRY